MDNDMNAIIIGNIGGLSGLAILTWILYLIIKVASHRLYYYCLFVAVVILQPHGDQRSHICH